MVSICHFKECVVVASAVVVGWVDLCTLVAQGGLMHAGVTGGCELPNMALGRAGSTLNHYTITWSFLFFK